MRIIAKGVVFLLLVACETIKAMDSVRVHYGKGKAFSRSWDAAHPGTLPKGGEPLEGDLRSFLIARGMTLDNAAADCMPEEGLPKGRGVPMPAMKPRTTVDPAEQAE